MAKKIIGGILIGISVIALIAELPSGKLEVIIPFVIFMLAGLFLLLKKSPSKEEKQQRKIAKQQAKEQQQRTLIGKHMAGLPLAEGIECRILFDENAITVSGAGNSFRVAYDKITDLAIKTDTEIQKSYVSSIGGAVGGAMLFGPLGAMVGGRAKEKTSTAVEYYFIITYNKDGALDYLSFQIYAFSMANKLIRQYRPHLAGHTVAVDL